MVTAREKNHLEIMQKVPKWETFCKLVSGC